MSNPFKPDPAHRPWPRRQRIVRGLPIVPGWDGQPAIRVARPSRWGNPVRVGTAVQVTPKGRRQWLRPSEARARDWITGKADREFAVAAFRLYVLQRLRSEPGWLEPLRGRDLACYCDFDGPCHADVLIKEANR